jgi:hypothetical protein
VPSFQKELLREDHVSVFHVVIFAFLHELTCGRESAAF